MNEPAHGAIADVMPAQPRAGVALHFTSLPSPYGIGDIGDAALAFVDALADMKLLVWQFLPTGPTAYGDSPYQPLSAFAGNENLIGLEPLVRDGFLSQEEIDTLRDLPHDTVDYGAVISRKGALLRLAAERFEARADAEQQAAYETFVAENDEDWLADYALYRILKSGHGERPWTEWATEYVRRDPEALAQAARANAADIACVKVLQFFFDVQWRRLKARAGERRVRLFGDMPIYIALDSADAWAHPEILRVDEDGRPFDVAGVPPDYFSEDGQLWGNPLYDWAHHERHGFSWWIERMAHAARLNDLVRVDHFRGFEAYWAVPFGEETAKGGRWEPGPRDALFEAMEQALGVLPIVAEDLGVITPEVDGLRLRHGIPGMVVLQFDVSDPDFDPTAMAPNSVCYTGTHDNDTTVGWFRGGEDDTRSEEELLATRKNVLRMTGGSPETIHLDLIEMAFASPAQLAIAPMQDFLGLGTESRVNIPGTTGNNWRWRLLPEQFTDDFRAGVARLVEACGRG
ncbi:MAG: 4-alpha-glucanotransferase [Pseudomonadota bacterium]